MAKYDYRCEGCGNIIEILQRGDEKSPMCCDRTMKKLLSFPAIIKIKDAEGNRIYSKGYKAGYSKEYLKSIES